MTQTAPTPDVIAISTPVTVTLGSPVSIDYPNNTGQLIAWAVVYNSSPFALVVKQDQPLGQVAAFNADVFPVQINTPIVCLPFSGSQLAQPGQDSIMFVTWYRGVPPGTFPTPLGSAGASFVIGQATDELFASTGVSVPATTDVTILAPTQTAGFSGLGLTMLNHTDTPIVVIIDWTTLAGDPAGARTFIIPEQQAPAAGTASVTFPHLGEQVRVRVRNATAIDATIEAFVSQTSSPVAQWAASVGDPTVDPVFPVFMRGDVTVPGNTALEIARSRFVYSGPATFSMVAGATAWIFDMQIQDSQGNWNPNFCTIGAGDVPGGVPHRFALGIIVPAAPLRVVATNADGADHSMTAYVMADDWRVGG